MNTGENEQALRKILDMTRLISLVVLFLHFYYEYYAVFGHLGIVSSFTDKILSNVVKTGMFSSFSKPKWIALLFLLISLVGAKGRKDEKLTFWTAVRGFAIGFVLYIASSLVPPLILSSFWSVSTYLLVTTAGYLLMLL